MLTCIWVSSLVKCLFKSFPIFIIFLQFWEFWEILLNILVTSFKYIYILFSHFSYVQLWAPLSMEILQAKNTGVGYQSLLQGIFPTQELNPGLPHCRQILYHVLFSSVQFSSSVMSDSLRPHEPQHSRPACPSPMTESIQTHVHWVSDAIQPSHSLSSPSSSALNLSQHQGLFQWVSSLHEVAKVLEFQLQHQSSQWTLVGSPCSPRDSQESSPTSQFKSINSLALSFLYSPTLTTIHDYWKIHSLD